MATQVADPDIDYTQGHIVMLLTSQTNDQERYTLVEKIILELINKNERLLERQDLLEARDIESKELFDKNDKLLVTITQELGKIQTLEKQLESVEGHPGDNDIKKTPVFIHTPDMKTNHKHFEHIEIPKCSDLQTSQFYNARVFKSKERAYIVDRLTTTRSDYPVRHNFGYKTIQSPVLPDVYVFNHSSRPLPLQPPL